MLGLRLLIPASQTLTRVSLRLSLNNNGNFCGPNFALGAVSGKVPLLTKLLQTILIFNYSASISKSGKIVPIRVKYEQFDI